MPVAPGQRRAAPGTAHVSLLALQPDVQIVPAGTYADGSEDGAGIRRDPTGKSGLSVGTEFDIIPNIHIDNHQDILLSYSYLFAGRFLRSTATSAAGPLNPHKISDQYSLRW